ncbi:uncharacterized protein ATC70_000891 [Mucor velutinosus]|uniref:Uncharacterized protein n=1 Tax=Mucor velutinosus TaxID=708070 RepID=A0AAN7I1V4_9FUNG|nr:hypothetical protein ATC70_000891 [Mucor velutinosus]
MAAPINLTNLVLRPDEGTLGRPIQVRANFFRVLNLPAREFYHYNANVQPYLPQQKMRTLWNLFEETHPEVVGNSRSIFDGRSSVFSVVRFELGQTQAQSFPMDVTNNPAFGHGGKENIFTIRLQLANTINMQVLVDFINGRSACTTNCLTAIMLLDILIRFLPSQTQFTFNRSIFSSDNKVPLSNGAEVWYGCYQSFRPAQGK